MLAEDYVILECASEMGYDVSQPDFDSADHGSFRKDCKAQIIQDTQFLISSSRYRPSMKTLSNEGKILSRRAANFT